MGLRSLAFLLISSSIAFVIAVGWMIVFSIYLPDLEPAFIFEFPDDALLFSAAGKPLVSYRVNFSIVLAVDMVDLLVPFPAAKMVPSNVAIAVVVITAIVITNIPVFPVSVIIWIPVAVLCKG